MLSVLFEMIQSGFSTKQVVRIMILAFISLLLSVVSAQQEVMPSPVSLDFKIGQMIMLGFRGLEINKDHPIVQDIRDLNIGGVVLFDFDVPGQTPVRNIQSPGQLRILTSDLQALTPTPLLIAVDYEGGKITRLKEKYEFPPTLSAEEVGRRNDPVFTGKIAEEMAVTLSRMGINLNFAPVVDLNINPESPIIGQLKRSYGSDPETVISHAKAFIQAHHEYNILCTLKHFPGHGSADSDTHLETVDITATWSGKELTPYCELIQTGYADAVMAAHLFNRSFDTEFPATLSRSTITGILRDQLGFHGVVISDDLQMKAIRDHYNLDTVVYRTILAGTDILVFANNSVYDENIGIRIIRIIKNLIRKGDITEERIEESYRRIILFKQKIQS